MSLFSVGSFRSRSCAGPSRRAFLQAGAAAPLLAGLPATTARAEYGDARAKSVVLVWLWGAPSHLDTFDPKPDAPSAYRGPFATIPTRTPGVRYTELVPRLAARSDRFALVRSNVNHAGGHPDAGTYSLTGYAEGPGPVRPAFGSIAMRHLGPAELPRYVMLGRGIPRDVVKQVEGKAGGGDWGGAYDPFLVACDDRGQVDVPILRLAEGVTPARLADRRFLTDQLDDLRRRVTDDRFELLDRSTQQAFTLLTSREAVQALDLSHEAEATRDAYGHTSFGQSLLLARRLVEAGTAYVHVNWSEYVEALTPNCDFGWDTHVQNFELLPNRHCPIFDRAFAAFLDDLSDRGLLDSTLVVCMGEFGRTPKINRRAARDHWPDCYFSIWAGAGVVPGRTVGESDDKAQRPVTRPIGPEAVGATIVDALGVNSVARTELNVLRDAKVIEELF